MTFGAYLLFTKDYCPYTDLQIGRFKSDITIIDSLLLDTDLFTETEQIMAFIKKHLMVEYIITDKQMARIERFDYPLEAIREIVVNMIVHRDYRDSGASIIKIFDDRIEFYNPGKLYGDITVNDLLSNNYTSKSRNKLIAKAFKEVGLIERYGSGIQRIMNICKGYGVVAPKFDEIQEGFRVVLFKEKLNVGKDVGKDLNEIKKSILNLIKNNNTITIPEIAEKLSKTTRTIERNINFLKQRNIIERVGGRKMGYWKVLQ